MGHCHPLLGQGGDHSVEAWASVGRGGGHRHPLLGQGGDHSVEAWASVGGGGGTAIHCWAKAETTQWGPGLVSRCGRGNVMYLHWAVRHA